MAYKALCDGDPLPTLQPISYISSLHVHMHLLTNSKRSELYPTSKSLQMTFSTIWNVPSPVLFRGSVFLPSGLSLNITSSEQYSLSSPLVIRYYTSLPVSFITLNTIVVVWKNKIGCNFYINYWFIYYLFPPLVCMLQKANSVSTLLFNECPAI